jgi:ABC-type uncharacterized transport system involved in gliding motility auxiliary subunit
VAGSEPRAPSGAGSSAARARVASSALTTVFVIALYALVNYLAFRHYERFDVTSDRVYTLSDRTKAILRGLDRDIDVYVFVSRGERSFRDIDELIARYQAESPRLRVRHVDPERDPAQFRVLAQRHGVGGLQDLQTGELSADVDLLVVAGDKHWKITRDDLVEFDLDSLDEDDPSTAKTKVKSEQALTGAIVQVTSGRDTTICVTKGHGEWSLEGGGETSLAGLRDELRRDNIALEEFVTRGLDAVPSRCDAVLVIGPRTAFSEAEATMLLGYVRGGGNLLVTADPLVRRDAFESTGLEGALRELGVLLDDDVVLERDRAALAPGAPLGFFLVTRYGEHPTVRGLGRLEAPTAMLLARSVRPAEGSRAEPLLTTSPEAYGEGSLAELGGAVSPEKNGADLGGPLPVAVAVEARAGERAGEGDERPGEAGRSRGGRVVVVGSSQWLMADFLNRDDVANRDLASALVGWLVEREALIEIAPRRVRARSVTMTDEDVTSLLFKVLVLLPLAVFFLGVAVWWTRRS